MLLTRTLPLFLPMLNHCLEMVSLTYADQSCHAHLNLLERYDKTIINNIQPFLNKKIHSDKCLLTPWQDGTSQFLCIIREREGTTQWPQVMRPPQALALPPPQVMRPLQAPELPPPQAMWPPQAPALPPLPPHPPHYYIERHLVTDGTCQILLRLLTDKTLLFYSPANLCWVFLSTNTQ